MPYIKIQTNIDLIDGSKLLKKLSSIVSKELGKSETSIMTAINPVENMFFAGSSDPVVFIECKSIGLNKEQTTGMSSVVCSFCKEALNVPKDRVYIEFSNIDGAMWGWDGRTL